MTIRVITPGLTDRQILERVLKALHDDDVESIVVHRPGSHLRLPDGREVIVDASGAFVAEPELAGAC